MTGEDAQRRSFASRTPANDNPDRVSYRRGFVTRHQVSGWRFVMRRIASGVALHDARMLVDPLRTQTRAVGVGALLVITGVIGCFVFSLLRPGGVPGDSVVLADRSTSALYVRVGERVHPVLNLTSARLIAGAPVNPAVVSGRELDRFPRGNLVGIPGAPERMEQSPARDADWTVCDGDRGVTVIAGPLDASAGKAQALADGHGVLAAAADGGAWLLWDGRRSRIDLANRAVTTALGIDAATAPRPVGTGLFNAIPEAPVLAPPVIPNAGQPPAFSLPAPAPVGAVVTAYASDATPLYYAVLPDGLQPISAVLAALLRNTDSYGLAQPPRLSADEIARLPASTLIDTDVYPDQRVTIVEPTDAAVACTRWTAPAGSGAPAVVLLSGSALPLADSVHAVELVSGGTAGTANRVATAPGAGHFVAAGAGRFWVSDTGVRYGVDTIGGSIDTVAALGLQEPSLPIPQAVLSLFAAGPTLSQADALLVHDGLAPDPRPGTMAKETR